MMYRGGHVMATSGAAYNQQQPQQQQGYYYSPSPPPIMSPSAPNANTQWNQQQPQQSNSYYTNNYTNAQTSSFPPASQHSTGVPQGACSTNYGYTPQQQNHTYGRTGNMPMASGGNCGTSNYNYQAPTSSYISNCGYVPQQQQQMQVQQPQLQPSTFQYAPPSPANYNYGQAQQRFYPQAQPGTVGYTQQLQQQTNSLLISQPRPQGHQQDPNQVLQSQLVNQLQQQRATPQGVETKKSICISIVHKPNSNLSMPSQFQNSRSAVQQVPVQQQPFINQQQAYNSFPQQQFPQQQLGAYPQQQYNVFPSQCNAVPQSTFTAMAPQQTMPAMPQHTLSPMPQQESNLPHQNQFLIQKSLSSPPQHYTIMQQPQQVTSQPQYANNTAVQQGNPMYYMQNNQNGRQYWNQRGAPYGNFQQQGPRGRRMPSNQFSPSFDNRERNKHARKFFPEHLDSATAEQRLKAGSVVLGALRVNAKNYMHAYATVEGFPQDVFIESIANRNRAFDGDVVVLELDPMSSWKSKAQPEEPLKHASENLVEVEDDSLNDLSTSQLEDGVVELEESDDEGQIETCTENNDRDLDEMLAREIKMLSSIQPAESTTNELPQQVIEEEQRDSPTNQLSLTPEEKLVPAPEPKQPSLPLTEQEPLHPPQAPHSLTVPENAEKPQQTESPKPLCPDLQAQSNLETNQVEEKVSQPTPQKTSEQHLLQQQELITAARTTTLQPLGKVVGIYEMHHSEDTVGYVEPLDMDSRQFLERDNYVLFRPIDKHLPIGVIRMFEIKTALGIPQGPDHLRNLERGVLHKLCHGKYCPWLSQHRRPPVRFISLIGQCDDIEAETKSILVANHVEDSPFPPRALEVLPKLPWVIPPSEIASRRDLRNKRIFTIDPLTCRDMDDALSCTSLPDGNFEVGVHIADVSYFVPPGSPLDKVAQERSTSVYLLQRVIPMLPETLANNLCSLNPDEDRLAFSAIWVISPSGEILQEWFGRTIIRSCAKLSYDVAQDCIEGRVVNDWSTCHPDLVNPMLGPFGAVSVEHIVSDILNLNNLAMVLRKKRVENGCIEISHKKLWFKLDEKGQPVSAHHYLIKESNKLVEEFMLLANIRVAMFNQKHFPMAIIRHHPPPKVDRRSRFSQMLENMGLGKIDFTSSYHYARSLDRARERASQLSPELSDVVDHLAAQSFQLAKYASGTKVDTHHYALGVDIYTHFTSPIRRYPDLLAHRFLLASIEMDNSKADLLNAEASVFSSLPDEIQLTKMCNTSNDRKQAARKASDSSSQLFLALLLKQRPANTPAIIISLGEKYITLFLPEYGFEVNTWMEDMPLDGSHYDEKNNTLTLKWSTVDRSKNDDIRKQIEFYFSDSNLAHDMFMRTHMGHRPDSGVSIPLILSFKRMRLLIPDMNEATLISSLSGSSTVEVTEDQQAIRRKKPFTLGHGSSPKQTGSSESESTTTTSTAAATTATTSIEKVYQLLSTVTVTLGARPNTHPIELSASIIKPVEATPTATIITQVPDGPAEEYPIATVDAIEPDTFLD
ncbi:mitotic control protein [Pelomyxa schiedti]|nr:mitotic control protein [Pelomyxa schiedti]